MVFMSASIDLIVWVVEVYVISLWGIGVDLVLCGGRK